ncbi:MAG TPA: NfeD family protein [Bauldia sp.]|nr:NfeD family protein [Bauldia sp.]
MMDTILQWGPWGWIIAGLILLGVEILAPGNVFVWFGVAALITGGFVYFTDFGWQIDALLFVVLAVVLVIAGRRYFSWHRAPSEQPFLNQRAAGLIGRNSVLAEPITGGQGRIRIDDTTWRVTGPDLPSGTRIRVAAADGAVLNVVKAE